MSYIPNTDADRQGMLEALGLSSLEDLFSHLPAELPEAEPRLPPAFSEMELRKRMEVLARENRSGSKGDPAGRPYIFRGAGAYEHFCPAAVRAIISRGEFLTSYTPYQPELSQGILQAIYEFQTAICELTGMEVANASLYDGASALAEAALMAMRVTHKNAVAFGPWVHPHYRQVVETYLRGLGAEVRTFPAAGGITDVASLRERVTDDVAAVLIQSPNFVGCIEPMAEIGPIVAERPALFVACVNPLSLGLLAPPGEYGADIAVGDVQPLGIPLAFGGPYAGFMATKMSLVRQMSGRIAAAAYDNQNRRGYVMTLQAREQHIRRERATSNICTNQNLVAMASLVYLALMGPTGLREIAEANVQNSHYLARWLSELPGCRMAFDAPFFNEFVLWMPKDPEQELLRRGFISGLNLQFHLDNGNVIASAAPVLSGVEGKQSPLVEGDCFGTSSLAMTHRLPAFSGQSQKSGEAPILWCVTETKSKVEMDRLVAALKKALP